MNKSNPEIWNERYNQEEYVYGEAPNEYLKAILPNLPLGKILLPAEGEGRNAVFAAKLGWSVYAFDQSKVGKEKADSLAQKNDVKIKYRVSNVESLRYPESSFDALVLIYAHFHSSKRKEYHHILSSYLKKGGILILEAFGKKHLKNQLNNTHAGGPKDVAMLYSLNEIKDDFKDFDFIEASEIETELNEGMHHLGRADVIRIYAIKK